MASLAEIYIKKQTLEMLLKGVNAKNQKGIGITVAINDEGDTYGNNVSTYVAQTKEERDDKKKRYYTGNGKVFWTDGKITKAEKVETLHEMKTPAQQAFDETPIGDGQLPF
jgi:hypothetical protein